MYTQTSWLACSLSTNRIVVLTQRRVCKEPPLSISLKGTTQVYTYIKAHKDALSLSLLPFSIITDS